MTDHLPLFMPRIVPALDAAFRPAVLANRAFRDMVKNSRDVRPLGIAIEQADGSAFHYRTEIFAEDAPGASANFIYIERLVKFLLWARGGWRIHIEGPQSIGERLA